MERTFTGAVGRLPRLHETENIPLKNKLIHPHFFTGGCDCYVAEFDGVDTFFGYSILNQDHQNAEWGYFSLAELKSLSVGWFEVDCEEPWELVPAYAIPEIRRRA
ncbi:MAG: DUF2958 domain-containing protein [Planctomycetota bacterium]